MIRFILALQIHKQIFLNVSYTSPIYIAVENVGCEGNKNNANYSILQFKRKMIKHILASEILSLIPKYPSVPHFDGTHKVPKERDVILFPIFRIHSVTP